MTKTRLIQWLDQNASDLDGIILDIDGVLINSGQSLPGSNDLLEWLRLRGMAYVLLTNDGNHSTQEKAAHLNGAGLTIEPEQIVSCGHAFAPLVDEKRWRGNLFFCMGDTGRPCYAEAAGLTTTKELAQLKHCSGVIIGEENYAWEPTINAVVNFFIDAPQAPLVVPNPDIFYPGKTIKIHIAAGGVARFIQQVLTTYGLEIDPIFLGKPYPPIFGMAHRCLSQQVGKEISAQRALIVGDNLASDIAGGMTMGYKTALMLTGVTSPATLEKARQKPDLVFSAL